MPTTKGRSEFGALLRQYRLEAGLSQEGLAERASMSADGISSLERGTNQAPQRETLTLLVRALGLDNDRQRALESVAVRPSRPRRRGTGSESKNNLPKSAILLYGRERNTADVKALVASNQLVTLTGAGGVGKTRLAIHVGEEMLPDFADGVWFVDLAPISDELLVAAAIARTFNIAESAERPRLEVLSRALFDKHMLLVVDNAEQVARSAAELATQLLRACEHMHMLVTSRQPLHVDRERVYRVPPLDTGGGIALFAERGRLASDTFTLSVDNHDTIERIVHRLDGIPLAIELAAARLRLLTPSELEERLSQRFRVLADPARSVLPRQQTMRATIDWSYESLEPQEQLLFRRLAVFPSTFSIDALNAICTDELIDEWGAIDGLGSLVDKSLVNRVAADQAHRYRLLENMRAYAMEKASVENDNELFRDRHARYYAELASRAEADRRLAESTTAWARGLEPELENFRAALTWTLDARHDVPLGAHILVSLHSFWMHEGLAMEAARRTTAVVRDENDLPPASRAAMLLTLARLYHDFPMTSQQMLDAASGALTLYEALDDAHGIAASLRELGIAQMRREKFDESRSSLQRALDLSRSLGDYELSWRAAASLGYLLRAQGKAQEARVEMLGVLKAVRDTGDERLVIITFMTLAELDFELGDIRGAVERARIGLANSEVMRKNSDLRGVIESNLAAYLFALGHRAEARTMALTALHESKYPAIPLQHLAAIIAMDDPVRAAKLLGYVEKAHDEAAFTSETTERYTYDRLLEGINTLLAPAEIEQFRRAGAMMTEDQILRLAHRVKS